MIKRIYTERQASNAALCAELNETLGISISARMFIRYDVEGLTDAQFEDRKSTRLNSSHSW